MTSTLLATLLLGADGLAVAPEAVVAVAVAYVVTVALPHPGPKPGGALSRAPAARVPSAPPG